jgi:hypothetical protein
MNLWKMPSRQYYYRAFWIGLPLSSKAAWAHRFAKPRADKSPICAVFSRAAGIQGEVEEPWIEIGGEGSPEERHVAGRRRIGYPMGLGSLEKGKVVQGRKGEIIRPRSSNAEQGKYARTARGIERTRGRRRCLGTTAGRSRDPRRRRWFWSESAGGGCQIEPLGSMSRRLCKNKDGEGRGHSNSAATEQAKRRAQRAGEEGEAGRAAGRLSETARVLAGGGCFVEAGSGSSPFSCSELPQLIDPLCCFQIPCQNAPLFLCAASCQRPTEIGKS